MSIPIFAHGGRVVPSNINHRPSVAQKAAGNYAKDHVCIHGLDITVENARGRQRSGIGRDGKKWSVRMPAHYGYIKKTNGADGDHVDCYIGPNIKSPRVYIIDQADADAGRFDEHKCMIGFGAKKQAIETYKRGFSDGRGAARIAGVHEMTVPQFKHWLSNADTTKPLQRASGGRTVADGGLTGWVNDGDRDAFEASADRVRRAVLHRDRASGGRTDDTPDDWGGIPLAKDGFDPDKYLASKPPFDPDKPYHAAPDADGFVPDKPISQGRAAAEGLASGLSANFSDELYGAAKAGNVPAYLSPLAAPIGAARMGIEYLKGKPGEATKRYTDAVAEARDIQHRAKEAYPKTYTASELGGSVAGMLVLPGGTVARGAGMGSRMLQGARLGAEYGALSGAGEGEDLASRASGAVVGGGSGALGGAAAAPVGAAVERAGSAAFGPAARMVRAWWNPEAEAARRVSGALGRDYDQVAGGQALGLTPTEYAAAHATGEPVALADMGGETTRALLRSAGNTSPEGRAAIDAVTGDRFAGQSERVASDIRQLVSGPANAQKTHEQLLAEYERSRTPAYRQAFAQPAAQRVWDDGFEQISQAPAVQEAIRGAMISARAAAARAGLTPPRAAPFVVDAAGRFTLAPAGPNGQRVVPNLKFWDSVKKNLDGIGTPEGRYWARTLRDRLDDLVPEYGVARGVAAKFFGGDNALEAGKKSMTFTGHPDVLRAQMQKMSPAERDLFREGRASAWSDRVLDMKDTANVTTRIFNSPHDRARAAAVFGAGNLDKLEARMRLETVMDAARTAMGNSTTARQLIEAGLAGGGIGYYLDGWHGAMAGAGTGLGAAGSAPHVRTAMALARSGAQKLAGQVDRNTARRVAELLTSDDPAAMYRGIQTAVRNKRIMQGLRSISDQIGAAMGSRSASGAGVNTYGALLGKPRFDPSQPFAAVPDDWGGVPIHDRQARQ